MDDVRPAVSRAPGASGERAATMLARLLPAAFTVVLLGAVWYRGGSSLAYDVQPLASDARSAATSGSTVVDSSLSLDAALRRFRVGLPVVDQLSGGAATREALVRRFVRAVEERDTASVRGMVLSRSEFAYLYYPHSAYTREPHKQMAGLVWFLTQSNSSKGISRVFDRLGGRNLAYRGHRCDPHPLRDGPNVLWQDCVLRLDDGGPTDEMRLFGSILQRNGRLKFVSYANDF